MRIPDNIVDVVEGGFEIKSETIYCENKECGLAGKDNICRHRCRDMLNKHYQNAFYKLKEYYNSWELAYTEKNRDHEVFGEYVQLFEEFEIPLEYSHVFFDSMIMDCSVSRYATYKQLEKYMYGSAAVIGLMMCKVMGVKDDRALPYAKMLGDAMQLTNFLRDIEEDVTYLDRIYVPLDDLQRHGLNHNDIINFANNFNKKDTEKWTCFKGYMAEQVTKCHKMYANAEKGYKYLPDDTKRAVSLAASLYEEILNKIERNNYDVFSKSARTNIWEKIIVVVKSKRK